MTSALRLGFIGVGAMGGPMARNLALAGTTAALRVFDVSAANLSAVLDGSEGKAVAAETAGDAAAGADVVVTMLPACKYVEEAYLGAGGILETAPEGALLVDCSTTSARTARDVAAAAVAAGKGFSFVDAPVSGGTAGAAAGTLTFMCGGEDAAVARAKDTALHAMGAAMFHAGAAGAGQVAKACNNMLLATHMVGTAEALRLGEAHGLDIGMLSEIMAASSGNTWSLQKYNPAPGLMEGVPASREYTNGFASELMLKDLNLAMSAADDVDGKVAIGAAVRDMYTDMAQTAPRKDFSGIYETMAAGKPV